MIVFSIPLLPTVAFAVDISLQGEQTSRYSRIYFNGNNTANFEATARGNIVSLEFNENVTITNNNVISIIPNIVKKIKLVNNKQIIITLSDSNYRIRNFVSNNNSGIDLIRTQNPNGLQRLITIPVPQAKPATKEPKNETPKETDKNAEIQTSDTTPTPPATVVTSDKPQDKILQIPAGVGRINKNHPIPVTKAPRHERMNELQKILRKTESEFSATYRKEGEKNILSFPWRKKVASAVFVREGVLWVVFDQVSDIDFHELEKINPTDLKFLGRRPSVKVTILRFNGNDFNNLKVWKKERTWNVSFGGEPIKKKGKQLKEEIEKEESKVIVPIYSSENNKRIVLNAGDYSSPVIKMTDPMILDDLRIIPIFTKRYVPNTHRMVDFDLLATAQGIAKVNKTDNVRIKPSHRAKELFISTPAGHAHRSAFEDIKAEETTEIMVEKPRSIIDFEAQKYDNGQELYKNITELQRAISFLSDGAKDQYMLELAQLYLSNQLYQESVNLMNLIDRNLSQLSQTSKFKFIKAVASYLNRQYQQADNALQSIDMKDPNLSNQAIEEIEFWKRATAMKLNSLFDKEKEAKSPIAYEKYVELFLSTYPNYLRNHFQILSTKQYLNLGMPDKANAILEIVPLDEIRDPRTKNEFLYLLGVYNIQTGDTEKGIDYLKDVKKAVLDRRNRAQAELALTRILYEINEIDIEEAINRLNQVRVIWRGDSIEKEALKLLGTLYIKNQEFPDGLRAWRDILTYFPSDRDSLQITKNMSQQFTDIFTSDKIEVMSEIDSLGLYYEFRELTPIGRSGDMIVQRLAERLVMADLLKRAASLLTHQVKFRLKGLEKSKVGARLAEIHLMNHTPKLALSALKSTEHPAQPIDLLIQRQLLRAQANIAVNNYKNAVKNLNGIPGVDAQMLRGHIYWLNNDWGNVIKTLSPLFTVEDNPMPLTNDLSDALLKLAIAYTFESKRSELNYLHDFFSYLMIDNGHNKEILDFLVNNIAPISHNDFTNTVNLDKMREFLRYYSKSKF